MTCSNTAASAASSSDHFKVAFRHQALGKGRSKGRAPFRNISGIRSSHKYFYDIVLAEFFNLLLLFCNTTRTFETLKLFSLAWLLQLEEARGDGLCPWTCVSPS